MIQGLIAKYIFGSKIKIIFVSTAQRNHTKFTKWLISKMDSVISTSKKATRPNELISSYLDPSKAKEKLNWESKTNIDLLIKKLYDQNLY